MRGSGRDDEIAVNCHPKHTLAEVYAKIKWPKAILSVDGDVIDQEKELDELELESGDKVDVRIQ